MLHLNYCDKRRKGLLSEHSQPIGIELLHFVAAQKQQAHREEEHQLFPGIHSCYRPSGFDRRVNTGNWKGGNKVIFDNETPDVVSVGIGLLREKKSNA